MRWMPAQRRRSRRPLVVLGALGPVLLLTVMSVLAWLWFTTSLEHSRDAQIDQSLEALRFAARSVATAAGKDLEMRFRDVEQVASDPQIIQSLAALESDAATQKMLEQLSDPKQAAPGFQRAARKAAPRRAGRSAGRAAEGSEES